MTMKIKNNSGLIETNLIASESEASGLQKTTSSSAAIPLLNGTGVDLSSKVDQTRSESESSTRPVTDSLGSQKEGSLPEEAPLTAFEQALEWERSVRKEKVAPISKQFPKIVLALDPLSEFRQSFSVQKVEKRIQSQLNTITEITLDPTYEIFREVLTQKKSRSMQATFDWVQPYLEKASEELSLKKELRTLYRSILDSELANLNNLFSQFQGKLVETIEFYTSQGDASTASIYQGILIDFTEKVGKQDRKNGPEQTRAALTELLNNQIDSLLKEQESKLLTDLKDSHRAFNTSKTVDSYQTLTRKRNKLLTFYKQKKIENAQKAYTDFLKTEILKMPDSEFEKLSK